MALIARVLGKAKFDRARGILVVPDWKGSVVQAVLDEYEDEIEFMERFRPYFECPDWFRNDTFRGWPKFDMIVYRLRF